MAQWSCCRMGASYEGGCRSGSPFLGAPAIAARPALPTVVTRVVGRGGCGAPRQGCRHRRHAPAPRSDETRPRRHGRRLGPGRLFWDVLCQGSGGMKRRSHGEVGNDAALVAVAAPVVPARRGSRLRCQCRPGGGVVSTVMAAAATPDDREQGAGKQRKKEQVGQQTHSNKCKEKRGTPIMEGPTPSALPCTPWKPPAPPQPHTNTPNTCAAPPPTHPLGPPPRPIRRRPPSRSAAGRASPAAG